MLFFLGLLLLGAVEGIVAKQLKHARRWLILQQFFDYGVWTLLCGLGILAAVRMSSLSAGASELFVLATIVCPLVLAYAAGSLRWRSQERVARELDARAPTKDRFLTALTLPKSGDGVLVDAAQREVAAFASTLSVGESLRPRPPWKKALWLLIPLATLGVFEGLKEWRAMRLAPELASAKQLLDQARQIAERHERNDEESRKIAEQIEKGEQRLAESPEPLREALRTIAELEQRLSQSSQLSAAETNALADALAQEHPELASNLRSGRNAEAAKGIEQLNAAELASALKQAARHLESRRLQELMSQDVNTARVQLTAMLSSSSGSQGEMRRQRLASALREMKLGNRNGQGDASPEAEGANFPRGREASRSNGGDNSPPTGSPGSEDDRGRGSDLAEQGEPLNTPEGSEDLLTSELGEGASLVEIFRASGGDDPKARRAYRSAYQVAAPAALDALDQENIPAGSRLLVRRYFESIRPKE